MVVPSTPYDEDDPLTLMEREAFAEATRRAILRGPETWLTKTLVFPNGSFETMVNVYASALRMPTSARLELLGLDSVIDRSRRLREHLEHWKAPPQAPAVEDSGVN